MLSLLSFVTADTVNMDYNSDLSLKVPRVKGKVTSLWCYWEVEHLGSEALWKEAGSLGTLSAFWLP